MGTILASTGNHLAFAMHGQRVGRRMLQGAQEFLAMLPRKETTNELIDSLQVGRHKAPVYVSTPITGGNRLYDFLAEKGVESKKGLKIEDIPAYNSRVIAANCKRAKQVARQVRGTGAAAIEPAAISLPGWCQTKYNEHWTEVVRDLPLSKVVVCDGWQLSYGCLLEVRVALDRGLSVEDENGQRLTRESALDKVREAVSQRATQGFNLGPLERTLTEPFESLPMEV